MSSEPIERRVSYLGDRLKASRCRICGKEYFEIRDYCGNCGRKSYGKMQNIDLFYDKGKLELCTLVNEPTNKFMKLQSFIYALTPASVPACSRAPTNNRLSMNLVMIDSYH